MNPVQQMAHEARRDNGGTWDLMGCPVTPKTGYFVSVKLAEREIESRTEFQDFVSARLVQLLAKAWNDAARPEYEGKTAYIGAWLRDDGAMVWDVSLHVPTLDEALSIGRANSQMAVWDCYNGRSIEV